MARGREPIVLRNLRTLYEVGTVGGLTDGELLDRFAAGPGEVAELAFAVLVERHGPMVLRACRRVLRDEHSAHDAFQATFLVLARKGDSVRRRDTLGPWLHGVALRVASCARSAAARRRRHESNAAARAGRSDDAILTLDEGAAIHEEIERLPERYRRPIVLCCLEGLTREQAALRLGWRVGTVQSRLARGRERLKERLIRRGLAPAIGTVAAALAAEAEAAMTAIPARLAEATIRGGMLFATATHAAGVVPAGVAALISGVVRAMLIKKLKIAAAASAAVVAVGVGITWGQSVGGQAEGAGPVSEMRLNHLERKIDRLIEAIAPDGPDRPADLETLQGYLALATADLQRAKDRVDWSDKMKAKGYVSEAQHEADKLSLLKAQYDQARAKSRLDAARKQAGRTTTVAQEEPPPLPIAGTREVDPGRFDRLESRVEAIERRLDALERRSEGRGGTSVAPPAAKK